MELSALVGGLAETEVLAAGGLSLGLAVLVMVVFRWEAELPFLVSLLFVPVVVGTGFVLAVAFQLWLDVTMFQSAGLLAGLLVGLVGVYELVKLAASDPNPPSARY
jgi:hypothetical protein